MEEQRRERQDEIKALLEKQVHAVEEATQKLKTSHEQDIKNLMEKHQQEVGFKSVCTKYFIRNLIRCWLK